MINPLVDYGNCTRKELVNWAERMYKNKRLTKKELQSLVSPRPGPSTMYITRKEFESIIKK